MGNICSGPPLEQAIKPVEKFEIAGGYVSKQALIDRIKISKLRQNNQCEINSCKGYGGLWPKGRILYKIAPTISEEKVN